jgi:hypothetical protein
MKASMRAGKLFAGLLILMLAGCERGPRAPVLSDEPVYQNAVEGFRFLAPPGWSQRAKANLPPGKLGKERLLVQYRRLKEGPVASLEVTALDAEAASEWKTLLAGPSFGITHWKEHSPMETIAIGPLEVQRYLFAGPGEKDRLLKDVVVFPRGERVYLFTGLYYASDVAGRDQFRTAVESTIWQ